MNYGDEELSICCAKLLFDIHKVKSISDCLIRYNVLVGYNIWFVAFNDVLGNMWPKVIIGLPSMLNKW